MTAAEIREKIAILDTKIGPLTRERAALGDQLKVAVLSELGVSIGGIVYCKGREYQVFAVDSYFGSGKPWLFGLPKLKNGTWGKKVRLYSDWQKESA